jgi:hypothetical protein
MENIVFISLKRLKNLLFTIYLMANSGQIYSNIYLMTKFRVFAYNKLSVHSLLMLDKENVFVVGHTLEKNMFNAIKLDWNDGSVQTKSEYLDDFIDYSCESPILRDENCLIVIMESKHNVKYCFFKIRDTYKIEKYREIQIP